MNRKQQNLLLTGIFLLSVALDQAVKRWAVAVLRPQGGIPLIDGVFQLTYCENTGMAFSLLRDKRWLLMAVTAVLLAVLLIALLRGFVTSLFGRISLVLVIGGAVGNAIDRLLLGYVVDLFDFCLIGFPIFNVADICLNVGVAMTFVAVLLEEKAKKKRGA